MNEQETIADITAEMRFHGQQNIDAEKDKPEYGILTVEGRIAQDYADRLEAAHKREKAAIEADALAVGGIVGASRATAENPSAVGDCAKLREALCEILSYIESFRKYITPGKGKKLTALFAVADTILSKARAALAEPVKNCEVGTAEEQYKRFMNMCNSKDVRQCAECSMRGFTPGCSRDRCFANWAQMPYEGGAK